MGGAAVRAGGGRRWCAVATRSVGSPGGVATLYVVLSLTFALVAFTPGPNAALVGFAAAAEGRSAEAAMDAHRPARNLDAPVLQRYVGFLVDLSTLRLGNSLNTGRPVVAMVSEAGLASLAYVLPAALASTLVGSAVGVYTTVRNPPVLDRLVAASSYTALAGPNFYLAAVTLAAGTAYGLDLRASGAAELGAPVPVDALVLAALVLSTSLLAAQLRYVRGETAARASEAFVVEAVPGVPGLGTLLLQALETRDVPLVVGSALAFVVAVAVTVAQDLLRETLDPRTTDG
jgi:peptide/nickel transport system permease protein